MIETISIFGVAAAVVALLAHIVLTLRAIREDVRKIEQRLDDNE